DISFQGVKGSEVQQTMGGLSADVWEHVVDWKPGAVHGGAELAAAIQRLQRLTSVRHVSVESSMREEGDSLRVDVGLQVQHGAPYDLSLELDLVRNNVRYGPRASLDLAALNARSRGGRRSLKVGFGYVAAQPFSTFSRDAWLNSAEWSLHWNAERLGVWPLALRRFHAKSEPRTRFDAGVDREIWPEFTRTQLQSDVSFVLKTGRTDGGRVECVPLKVSYVNLTNRSDAFREWLEFEASPLVAGRFINHLNVGSTLLWANSWSGERLSANVSLQSSWGGWFGQTVAEQLTQDPSRFHPETGAWMVREGVPLVQHQRHLVQVHLAPHVRGSKRWSPHVRVQAGWAGVGANTVSLPLEHSFLSGGANGIRGWRLRELGPGNLNPENVNVVVEGLGDLQAMLSIEWRSHWVSHWDLALFVDAGNVWLHGADAPAVTKWGDSGWAVWP
ncbi:MAG: BamA/TamA family outer membrane protein, partial [Flavobacteriales bacterium]